MSAITYAQALNEAKQMIVQQQLRIKGDAEKIRSQQQTIVDQSTSIAESEKRIREQSSELQRMVEEGAMMSSKMQALMTAKEQAEAIIDRQGNRLTQMQEQATDMERRMAEQASRIESMMSELEGLRSQLPSREDEDALASMADLLTKRSAAMAARRGGMPMRMADESGSEPMPMAEAA